MRSLALGLLLAVLDCAVGSARAGEPVRFVVFGDSISDPGNHFALFGRSARPPFQPEPDAPYRSGAHRFSNGPTWIEQLARRLGVPRDGGPALRNPLASNYAIGAARARPDDGSGVPIHLAAQLGYYAARGAASAQAWHVLAIGGNDVRDALLALGADGANLPAAQAILAQAASAVSDAVLELHGRGVRRFLVLNAPDLGLAPAVRGTPALAQAASQLSAAYNAALAAALAALAPALPDARFAALDQFSLLRAASANPAAFGLREVAQPCLRFGVLRGALCAHPDRFLFWDAIHPTRAGHAVLAEFARRALGAASAP